LRYDVSISTDEISPFPMADKISTADLYTISRNLE